MSDRLRQIKKRLREIKRNPGSAAPGEAQRLTGEYRRLTRPAPGAKPSPAADSEAIKTWPRELRARLGRSPMSRVIDGSNAPHDPNDYGAKSDLRRGRHR
ncbi:hypothetical protein [Streptomyces parvulus]|uniref:hypothetical protein n=1 Tax=Streptomyces parvulus TaxID=146923 RepID=UPI00210ED8FF|nr:hypothetical protein [Streptomyces parvulus]MCQ4193868.1 hypothetical protein [Streptomyces parvulus]